MAALTRRTMLAGLAAAAVLRPERAFAAWPDRNISLIHGLTAGGGVDVSARVIAEGLSRKLGQQIVVETEARRGRHAWRRRNGARHARRLSAGMDSERPRRHRRDLQVAAL